MAAAEDQGNQSGSGVEGSNQTDEPRDNTLRPSRPASIPSEVASGDSSRSDQEEKIDTKNVGDS